MKPLLCVLLFVFSSASVWAFDDLNGRHRLWFSRKHSRRPPPPAEPTVNSSDHKMTKTEQKEEARKANSVKVTESHAPPPTSASSLKKPSVIDATDLEHKKTRTEQIQWEIKGNSEEFNGESMGVISSMIVTPISMPLPRKPSIIDATGLDHKMTKTSTARKFDVQPAPWRLPWLHRPLTAYSTARVETTTAAVTSAPIVLYKRDCDPCLPGYGIESLCNTTSNTVCKRCPMGTWSPQTPHYRPCEPCAKCGPTLYEQVPCATYRDTKCDSCSNPGAIINDDYMKKCNWWNAGKTANPIDLDDTRFNAEVFDMQSKELNNFDGSPEFASNEEDLDRLLLSPIAEHEEDITVDDPEIDLEQPKLQEEAKLDENLSKEAEAEMTNLRREADEEMAQLSKRLEAEHEAELEDDDDDEAEQGPRRLLLHPIRPFPQMVPVPKRADFGELEEDIVRPSAPPVNRFPPSYHDYNIDSLVHAGQRRKAIVLLVLTCAIVLLSVIFVVCYVREYCRRRGAMYNRVLVVNMSPEEREIVRHSASILERMEQAPKKHHGSGRAYTAMVDEEDVHSGLNVTENPLEDYLNAIDEGQVAEKPLIENEVNGEDDPKVHRSVHA